MEIVLVGIAIFVVVVGFAWMIDGQNHAKKVARRMEYQRDQARMEVTRLRKIVEDERVGRLAAQEAYTGIAKQQEALLDRFSELATRPPQTIDPTPIIDSLRRVFVPEYDAAAQPDPVKINPADLIPLANGAPRPDQSEVDRVFLPDVEMDEWIEKEGFPTKGGWVNPQTNSLLTPMEGQTPVHTLSQDGRVTRADGQPMFRPGDGHKQTPPGGLED